MKGTNCFVHARGGSLIPSAAEELPSKQWLSASSHPTNGVKKQSPSTDTDTWEAASALHCLYVDFLLSTLLYEPQQFKLQSHCIYQGVYQA